MRTVVCDTGPVLHLHEAGQLDWLSATGTVCIPPAVDHELDAYIASWPTVRPPWLAVQSATSPGIPQAASACQEAGLGSGETEAILLALDCKADWLLTDDATARVIAELLGLEVHGSLGVVLWRATLADVDAQQARQALDRLAATSLWVSPGILAQAKTAMDRILTSR